MLTVLLAEPEPALRAALGEALSGHCFVREAATLAQVREQLAESPAHLLLANNRLPDGRGVDACSLARESSGESQGILYGNLPSTEEALEAMHCGVGRYIVGPAQIGALVEAVLEGTDRHSAQTAKTREINELRSANDQLARRLEQRTRDLFDMNDQIRAVLDRMQTLVTTDELTGLGNCQAMQAKLQQVFRESRRYGTPFTCVLCAPAGMESIINGFGAKTGQLLMQEIALRLQQNLREVDYTCRANGDDFVLLLPYTTSEQSLVLVRRLHRLLDETPFVVNAVTISLTFFFGVSQASSEMQNGRELFQHAVEAAREAINVKTPPAVHIYKNRTQEREDEN